jgi:predicted DCC family thiol-disulfide oxidoreductase YuxK
VRKRDKAGRVLVLPNQTPDLIEKYGLTRADVDWALWTVAPDGSRWSGAAGVNRALQELGSGWSWLAALYELRLFHWIEDRVYRWVAEHRSWLSRWFGAPPEWNK